MASLLQHSHIACLPSYREGLPLALIEAMASGRPCVTTDVPGCREVVQDGQNGFLVPPRDPANLAKALRKLILDKDLRIKMGDRGRIMALERFSKKVINEKILSVYRDRLASLENSRRTAQSSPLPIR